MRVLLVEDDEMIGAAMEQALKEAAYAVDRVRDGIMALEAIRNVRYGIVLLDLGLPGKDGLEVLRVLRKDEDPVPVLIITARDALEDRLSGLDGGADDYVVKPFAMSELLARMRAITRRRGGAAGPLLSNGRITLDPATHEASVDNKATLLSAREYSLLQALIARPGAILSRGELEERIYGWGQEVESSAVDFLIHSLRKKLGPEAIKNVRGAGWMVPGKRRED